MRLAIMQPYFFPYIGYFQLIASVDLFILYDNIKYTKKGWINRNRMLQNGKDEMFTLPLKSGSDYLDVRDRVLAADFSGEKFLKRIAGAYRRAPYYAQTVPMIEQIVMYKDRNLFGFIHHSVARTCKHLRLATEIRVSSTVDIDHGLKNQEKVIALCNSVGASTYVNAIGGMDIYSKKDFVDRGIGLKFIKSHPFEYAQFGREFIAWLSIVDVMMFNPVNSIIETIKNQYDLI